MKVKRARLERGIMKMRLERAFLLEQLGRRMECNVDGSDGSSDEDAVGTPPLDRPHRDKRRRPTQAASGAPPPPPLHASSPYGASHTPAAAAAAAVAVGLPPPPMFQRLPSDPAQQQQQHHQHQGGYFAPPDIAALRAQHSVASGHLSSALPPPPPGYSHPPPPQLPHGSPYGGAPVGVPGATAQHVNGMTLDGAAEERHEGAMRDSQLGGGGAEERPSAGEPANGARQGAGADSETGVKMDIDAERTDGGGGFTAVNQ